MRYCILEGVSFFIGWISSSPFVTWLKAGHQGKGKMTNGPWSPISFRFALSFKDELFVVTSNLPGFTMMCFALQAFSYDKTKLPLIAMTVICVAFRAA